MASALALQRSNNWAVKTHTLGVGQFVQFILTCKMNEPKNDNNVDCGNTNLNEDTIIAVVIGIQTILLFKLLLQLQWSYLHLDLYFYSPDHDHSMFQILQISLEKKIRASMGFKPWLCSNKKWREPNALNLRNPVSSA